MPRYIAEYQVSVSGGKLTVPTCAKFLGVTKVANKFVLLAEIWGNPEIVEEIDVKIFHKDGYMRNNETYIGFAVSGTTIYHVSYTVGDVEDLGGDGGFPLTPRSIETKATEDSSTMPVSAAGGMKEC